MNGDSFLILTAALQSSDAIFLNYQTVLLDLILAFTHLVIIYTLLILINQKLMCSHLLKVPIVILTTPSHQREKLV